MTQTSHSNSSRWDYYCNATWVDPKDGQTKLTGDAEFAREVRNTPLEADAMLDLLYDNLDCARDSYYLWVWTPVEMRLQEYFEKRKQESLSDVSYADGQALGM